MTATYSRLLNGPGETNAGGIWEREKLVGYLGQMPEEDLEAPMELNAQGKSSANDGSCFFFAVFSLPSIINYRREPEP